MSRLSRPSNLFSLFVVLGLGSISPIVVAEDWPQWNGPQRTGMISETLATRVPEGGFPKLWSVPVSYGYSGPAVAKGKVFVTDYEKLSGEIENNPGGRSNLTGNERTFCIDEKTGKVLWQKQVSRPYSLSYAAGPRVTPTVDDDRVYTLGAEGDLICHRVSNGEIVWQRQLRGRVWQDHSDLGLFCLSADSWQPVDYVGGWRRLDCGVAGQDDR